MDDTKEQYSESNIQKNLQLTCVHYRRMKMANEDTYKSQI